MEYVYQYEHHLLRLVNSELKWLYTWVNAVVMEGWTRISCHAKAGAIIFFHNLSPIVLLKRTIKPPQFSVHLCGSSYYLNILT